MEIVRIGRRWINLGRLNSAKWSALDHKSLVVEIGEVSLHLSGEEARELAHLLDMASLNATWSATEAVPDAPVEVLAAAIEPAMTAEPRHPPVVVLVEADLEIDGDRYRISRNEHPTYTAYLVRKVTGDRGGEVYECRRFRDGRIQCNCKDAQCRKRNCKHVLSLIRVSAFPPPVDPAEVEAAFP